MSTNGHPKPNECAVVSLTVDRYDDPGKQPVFEHKKSITKHGRTFHRSVWITLEQLKAVARGHCG